MYATGVTRVQNVVLRRFGTCRLHDKFPFVGLCEVGEGGRGHFRSRDKDGGHTIRSAIADNPMLYANFTTLSFIEPELLPIEVLHCGNREFRVFLRKIVDIIKNFCSHPKKDVAVTEARLLSHKTRKSDTRCDL